MTDEMVRAYNSPRNDYDQLVMKEGGIEGADGKFKDALYDPAVNSFPDTVSKQQILKSQPYRKLVRRARVSSWRPRAKSSTPRRSSRRATTTDRGYVRGGVDLTLGVVFMLALAGCADHKPSPVTGSGSGSSGSGATFVTSLEQMVGRKVTIEGVARNAAAGAVVFTDDRTPVYVAGLDRWDSATDGKKISASGTLRKRGGSSLVNTKGEVSEGIPGYHFELEQPSWTVR